MLLFGVKDNGNMLVTNLINRLKILLMEDLWKKGQLDFNNTNTNTLDYFKNRKQLKIDSYVINDYHVNKKYSLEKFTLEGSYIKDETTQILGDLKFNQYKDYYILQKTKYTYNKQKEMVKVPIK